jgi:hypothetical protein
MATDEQLRKAADRIALTQKKLALADKGWQLLGRSRAAFISSMRHTGLSYAHAQTKFDDFVEEQRRLHRLLLQELEAAQNQFAAIANEADTSAAQPQPSTQA